MTNLALVSGRAGTTLPPASCGIRHSQAAFNHRLHLDTLARLSGPRGAKAAPIGAHQPRPQDLPAKVLREEGRAMASQRNFDKSLEVCSRLRNAAVA